MFPEADLCSRVVGIGAALIIGSLVIGGVTYTSLALRAERALVETGTLVLPIVFHHLLLLRCHHLVGRVLVCRLVGLVESVPGLRCIGLSHHLDALTWLHHRENLGETLAVLNIDEASQRRFRLLIRQIKFI